MSCAFPEPQCVAHAVALNRLQARRADDVASSLRASVAEGFADTMPLWFRSEAFAEDVLDAACASVADTRRGDGGLQRVDAQVMAAGAAVLRLTLQALRLQRR